MRFFSLPLVTPLFFLLLRLILPPPPIISRLAAFPVFFTGKKRSSFLLLLISPFRFITPDGDRGDGSEMIVLSLFRRAQENALASICHFISS